MAAPRKCLILIVEGRSEEVSLGLGFSRAFPDYAVKVLRVDGDMMFMPPSKKNDKVREVKKAEILKETEKLVKGFLRNSHIKPSDVSCIVQLIDADGSYVLNQACLAEDPAVSKPVYLEAEIRCPNRAFIMKRNFVRSANINEMVRAEKVCGIPYSLYYMSCNLDHVLHGNANTPSEEKTRLAQNFERDVASHPEEFKAFLARRVAEGVRTAEEGWGHLRQGCNSLSRCSNLFFAL